MITFYKFATTGTRAIALGLANVEVTNLEYLPRKGPVILTPNHLHLTDPAVLSAFLPRKVHYMVKQEAWEEPIFGRLSRWFEAYPVRRGRVDLTAYRTTLRLLADGSIVGIFPEGHRSPDGQLQVGNSGAIVLAQRSGAPIVPVAITGIREVLQPSGLLRRRTIHIVVGEPFHPPRGRSAEVAELTAELMARIARLLPEPAGPGRRVATSE